MFLVHVNYSKPLDEIDKHLVEHRVFLDKYYDSGNLICSGPRIPRTSGIIICNAANKEEVWNIIHEDPFYTNGVADYEVIEFNPVKYAKGFEPFIK